MGSAHIGASTKGGSPSMLVLSKLRAMLSDECPCCCSSSDILFMCAVNANAVLAWTVLWLLWSGASCRALISRYNIRRISRARVR